MSVQTEINRINGNISDAYDSIEDKGGTVPEVQNSDNLADAVATIPAGGLQEDVKISITAEYIPAE